MHPVPQPWKNGICALSPGNGGEGWGEGVGLAYRRLDYDARPFLHPPFAPPTPRR